VKKIFFLILVFLFAAASFQPASVWSQEEINIPLEFRKAYQNNTRSYDGKPGINYRQNRSEYKINAFFDTKTRTFKGTADIVYYNNSPDRLDYIIIRLLQNWNKAGKARDWDIDTRAITDGFITKKINVNNVPVDINDGKSYIVFGTNAKLTLPQPLESQNKIQLSIEWEFQLPEVRNLRMGRYDEATYLIAYWYPQIAVYDDVYGWDEIDYPGMVEFYGDISDFDVTIEIDNKDAVVWASGVLQNPENIFQTEIYERYKKAETSKEIVKIITTADKNILKNQSGNVKWNYIAKNVPDFVFAFSDKYLWDASGYETSPGKFTMINSAYKPDAPYFNQVASIARGVIKYLSEELPGMPFPYPRMTVFNGSGGMEYPMFVNDEAEDSYESTVYLTAHEISHTYFPFYMGTNEKRFAWMDEGWAVLFPGGLTGILTDDDYKERAVQNYIRQGGTTSDLPLITPSYQIKSPAYRFLSYVKSSNMYYVLQDMLGDELFKKVLKEYINRWNGKHPMPLDFIFTVNDVTGKNLNWFWNKWIFGIYYADIAIENTGAGLNIINKGGLPIPVHLQINYNDGSSEIKNYSAEVWENKNSFGIDAGDKKIKSVFSGNKYIPDIDTTNNSWTGE
jgi:hypothetical protein